MANENLAEKEYILSLISDKEKCLLRLLFGDEYTEEKIALLIDNLEISFDNMDYLLVLSILGEKNGWRFFPTATAQRLRELYRYQQADNASKIPFLQKIVKLLCDEDIPVMFIKGIALRCFYAKGLPRQMSDVDIVVPEASFTKALTLIKGAGYKTDNCRVYHACVTDGKNDMDLHSVIFKNMGDVYYSVWEDAIPYDFYGNRVYLPSPATMFLHQLDNRIRDLISGDHINRRLKWLYDSRMVANSFTADDYKKVSKASKALYVEKHARLAMKIYEEVYFDLFCETAVDDFFPANESYYSWLSVFLNNLLAGQAYTEVMENAPLLKKASLWLSRELTAYRIYKKEDTVPHGPKTFIGYFFWSRNITSIKDLFNRSVAFSSKE